MKREITYYSKVIQYNLIYKNVKNINIRILPDKTVNVSANSSVEETYIDYCLKRKASYILKCFDKFDEQMSAHNTRKELSKVHDGSLIMFVGKMITVRVIKGSANHVSLEGLYLYIECRDPYVSDIETVIKKWYSDQCLRVLGIIADKVYERMRQYIGIKPQISYRWMHSRWGSCQPDIKKIIINKEIIRYRPELIEFVLVHEFSHLIYTDHSAAFYRFMDSVLPDHRSRKAELDADN